MATTRVSRGFSALFASSSRATPSVYRASQRSFASYAARAAVAPSTASKTSTTTTAQRTVTPSRTPPTEPPVPTARTTKVDSANAEAQSQRSLTEGLSDAPAQIEGVPAIDWTRSYHGLGSDAFTPEQAEILLAPVVVEDIEVKPDGILYLPEIKYRRILNRAFGPGGWGLAPRGESIVTSKIVTREYGMIVQGR